MKHTNLATIRLSEYNRYAKVCICRELIRHDYVKHLACVCERSMLQRVVYTRALTLLRVYGSSFIDETTAGLIRSVHYSRVIGARRSIALVSPDDQGESLIQSPSLLSRFSTISEQT